MNILLESFKKFLEQLFFSYANRRVIPEKNSFVRKNFMNNKNMGLFKTCATRKRGQDMVTIWCKKKNEHFRGLRVFHFALYPKSKTRKSRKYVSYFKF